MARKRSDMVNEVLAHFDFEKVHKVMTYLNWKWFDKASVPSISDLKESAEHHLYSAIEQALSPNNTDHHEVGWMSASGGFEAMAWKNEDGTLARVRLEFVVADWSADDSEVAE
jgi:hypothetical protein